MMHRHTQTHRPEFAILAVRLGALEGGTTGSDSDIAVTAGCELASEDFGGQDGLWGAIELVMSGSVVT